jgi:glutamate synthase domain-containing protein 2
MLVLLIKHVTTLNLVSIVAKNRLDSSWRRCAVCQGCHLKTCVGGLNAQTSNDLILNERLILGFATAGRLPRQLLSVSLRLGNAGFSWSN